MVMDCAVGSLRKILPTIIEFNWCRKLRLLRDILYGLETLHKLNFVHRDLHDGNILFLNFEDSMISDLGLCKPVSYFNNSSTNKENIYGVIPFMAPEVLRGNPYTQASDIYSFSMIMWEFISGLTPFDNRLHDLQLCLNICKGERPELNPEII